MFVGTNVGEGRKTSKKTCQFVSNSGCYFVPEKGLNLFSTLILHLFPTSHRDNKLKPKLMTYTIVT